MIIMAHDMDRETVEQERVLPVIDQLEEAFDLQKANLNLGSTYAKLLSTIMFHRIDRRVYMAYINLHPEVLGPLEALRKLYPVQLKLFKFPVGSFLEVETAAKTWLDVAHKFEPNYKKFEHLLRSEPAVRKSRKDVVRFDLGQQDDWWLRKAGADKSFLNLKRGLAAIRKDIKIGRRDARVFSKTSSDAAASTRNSVASLPAPLANRSGCVIPARRKQGGATAVEQQVPEGR